MVVKRATKLDPLTPVFIQEMIGAGKKILEYCHQQSFASFVGNQMLTDAVQHQFEILGEASTHISFALRNKFKVIPWTMMYSLRNHIAHEYFDIDYEILWEIVQHDLPRDVQNLEHMLDEVQKL